jgi:hypothetical protein
MRRICCALSLSLAPTFAAAGPPGTDAGCLAWARRAAPTAAATAACVERLLWHGYLRKPDAEALQLDPAYQSTLELALDAPLLAGMKAHLVAGCPSEDAAGETNWRCKRAHELVDHQAARRLRADEWPAPETLLPALAKVLAGEPLTEADLAAEGEPRFSPLGLWKLRNAAYARHGLVFKDPELNAFFYGPRPSGLPEHGPATAEQRGLLPLPAGQRPKVTLSATDGANVRLIKRQEERAAARIKAALR